MKTTFPLLVFFGVLFAGVLFLVFGERKNMFVENIENELEKAGLIRLKTPRPNEIIKSPLVIEGEARGYWFFEASFPVLLTDWDVEIIAEHYAEAQSEWMTEEFVPFKAELRFSAEGGSASGGKNPSFAAPFSKRGTLILKKDNPSGLPEHDDALEIPIRFE